jgi:hypothetical protein
MFLTIIGGMIFVGSLGNGKFQKGNMVLLRQKEVVYFSLLIKKVIVSLADFAENLHEKESS